MNTEIETAKLEEQKFLKNVLGFGYRACFASSLLGVAGASVSFANGHNVSGGLYCVAVVMLVTATTFVRKRYLLTRNTIVELESK